MTKLTLIRHAPTAANKKAIFMGRLDLPSTEEGLSEAQTLGAKLRDWQFTQYRTSPLLRAKATAKHIFPEIELIGDDNLTERDLGDWAGKPKDEVREQYPNGFYDSGNMNPFFTPPNGESLVDFVARVHDFVQEIAQLEDGHVVAVSHNGVIRVIRCLIELRPLEEIFVAWEPYLQPRTYLLDKLQAKTIQAHFNTVIENTGR